MPRRWTKRSSSPSPTKTRRRRISAVAHAQGIGATEPFDTPIGPFKERGAANGLIVKNGYVVAEWGEPSRVDMTFSVTKTFLSTVVGLAWQKGSDPRRQRPGARLHAAGRRPLRRAAQPADHVGSPAAPDQRLAGHAVGQAGLGRSARRAKPSEWANRKLHEPGTRYKYNDVRVNAAGARGAARAAAVRCRTCCAKR